MLLFHNIWVATVFVMSVHFIFGLHKTSVLAQYYGNNKEQQPNSLNYAEAPDYAVEDNNDRPRLHLGLRVKIPAMKFELPRMSLPKITISAKIRQPNRPRVINLPAINLDTSSKVATPIGGGQVEQHNNFNNYDNQFHTKKGAHTSDSSSYESNANSYQPNNYESERTQTFTIATSGEEIQHNPRYVRQKPKPPVYYGHMMNYNRNSNPNNNEMRYSASNYQATSLQPSSEYFENSNLWSGFDEKQPTFQQFHKADNDPPGLLRFARMLRPSSLNG